MQKKKLAGSFSRGLALAGGHFASPRTEKLSLRKRRADFKVDIDGLSGATLSLISARTGPETGEISLRTISHLLSVNVNVARELASGLKRNRLIDSISPGSEVFFLTEKGIAFLNANGHKPSERAKRISQMSSVELEERLARLQRGEGSIDASVRHSAIIKLRRLIAQNHRP